MNLREELTRITTAAEALRAEGGDPVIRQLGEIIGRAAAAIESACKAASSFAKATEDKAGCIPAQPETRKPIGKEDTGSALPPHQPRPMCDCIPARPIRDDAATMHNERKGAAAGDFTIGKVAMQELIRKNRAVTVYGAVKLIAAQIGGVTSLAELLGVEASAVCRAARAETVKAVIDGMKRHFSFPRIGDPDLENLKANCRAILDEAAVYTVRAALDVLAVHEVNCHSISVMINVSNQSVLNMYNRPDTTAEFDEKFKAVFTIKEA